MLLPTSSISQQIRTLPLPLPLSQAPLLPSLTSLSSSIWPPSHGNNMSTNALLRVKLPTSLAWWSKRVRTLSSSSSSCCNNSNKDQGGDKDEKKKGKHGKYSKAGQAAQEQHCQGKNNTTAINFFAFSTFLDALSSIPSSLHFQNLQDPHYLSYIPGTAHFGLSAFPQM